MRRFAIHAGNVEHTVHAATVQIDDAGVVAFLDDEQKVVGLARTWDVVVLDDVTRLTTDDELVRSVAAIARDALAAGELPELADPFDQFPEDAVVNPRLEEMRAAALSDETDQPATAVSEHLHDPSEGPLEDAVGDHEEDIIAGRIPPDDDQTSEPDAPGVSTDPAPDPEPGDVDANPPQAGPEPESTGADDPPAGDGPVRGDDDELLRLREEVSKVYARASGTPALTAHMAWLQENGIKPAIGKSKTVEELQARLDDITARQR